MAVFGKRPRVTSRVIAVVLLGAILSPLNTAMIAVALLPIVADFGIGVIALSWLISSFYLVAAVGQSVLGRLADQLGPRRLLCLGFSIAALGGAIGGLAPSFAWLLGGRLLIAVGTAATIPAGFAVLRDASGGHPPSPTTLAWVTAGVLVTAAVSPAVGGGLVALADWEAIFFVNVAIAAIGIPLALRWLSPDSQHAGGVGFDLVRRTIDLPGILAFSVMMAAALALILSLDKDPLWWLAPVVLLGGAALVAQSLRRGEPFLELPALAANRGLLLVCLAFLLVNIVAFGVLLSISLWLGAVRGYGAGTIGLLLIPLGAVGVAVTPIAARMIARTGWPPAVVVGAVGMLSGTLLMSTLGDNTSVLGILGVVGVLGVPVGFNNLALQTGLYAVTEHGRTAAGAGLSQTARYVGAVLATSAFGVLFANEVTSARLHVVGFGLAIVSVLVLLGALILSSQRYLAASGASGP